MNATKQDLAHVYFIGGATDSGKSTLAALLAERHGLQVYHYDRTDLAHHQQLAQADADIARFMRASLDENWVIPTPDALVRRTLRSFDLRFPLVIGDLLALSKEMPILAEGFGFTPVLLKPLLRDDSQAIWLVPTKTFKRESMERRGKPSFGHQVSDPTRARQNLLERDFALAEIIEEQVRQFDLCLMLMDGSSSPAELIGIILNQWQQNMLSFNHEGVIADHKGRQMTRFNV